MAMQHDMFCIAWPCSHCEIASWILNTAGLQRAEKDHKHNYNFPGVLGLNFQAWEGFSICATQQKCVKLHGLAICRQTSATSCSHHQMSRTVAFEVHLTQATCLGSARLVRRMHHHASALSCCKVSMAVSIPCIHTLLSNELPTVLLFRLLIWFQ